MCSTKIIRVGSVILLDAVSELCESCSTVKVVMLNYTVPGRGGVGVAGEGGSSVPATQHAKCLPGSFPPALIPDTARGERKRGGVRREDGRR